MFCQVYNSHVSILADLFSHLFHVIILGFQQKSWKKYTFAYFYITSIATLKACTIQLILLVHST